MKAAGFCSLLLIIPLFIPVASAGVPATGHPYLLFHDIRDTPGYQFHTTAPWSTWETYIIRGADTSLSRNFTSGLGSYDRVQYRGEFARDLGLAYQITRKAQYATKAREALLNLDVGTVAAKVDRANALGHYSLAYDFIQPTLDPATDAKIRDKLATLADTVYKDLNDSGATKTYIAFGDYHGQAYPMLGIAGAALYDYTNPKKLPLTSTPADWKNVGTEYLFVSDPLHTYGRSLFSFGFDEATGKHLNGAYKNYVIENLGLWLQVSYHANGENLLEKYPVAKRAVTTEVWDSLPNGYAGNYVTNGNTGWAYHKTIVSLLPDNEKGEVLNHVDRIEKSTVLPYSSIYGATPNALLYCVFGNYASIPRTFPANTTYLNPNGTYQVFRESWADDADWLSLITFNVNSRSNRDSMHNDQLSFEYYGNGDLLLADAGETKKVLDKYYGYTEIHHNTIALEDPRTPFPVSPWSNSASAGIFKGGTNYIVTPVTVGAAVQTPWMQLIQTSATITEVMVTSLGTEKVLSSPIQYERSILYPESEYFIVVDRMKGTQPWVYRNVFRPTSLMVTPTADTNKDGVYAESEVGHVNGALTLGSTPYNWQALPYKSETKTGITANSLTWSTTNPYGKAVTLNLVSAPASEILIEKNVGRIGGYGAPSEVYNPVVWFRTPQSTSQYRVTALLSRYGSDTAKTAAEIPVTGTGHALRILSGSSEDYVFTGKGTSSFAGFTTDADTVFVRMENGTPVQFTMLGGSFLDYDGDHLAGLSRKTASLTVRNEGDSTECLIYESTEVHGSLLGKNMECRSQSPRNNMLFQETRMAGSYEKASVISSGTGLSQEWYLTFCHIIDRVRQLFFDWSIYPAL